MDERRPGDDLAGGAEGTDGPRCWTMQPMHDEQALAGTTTEGSRRAPPAVPVVLGTLGVVVLLFVAWTLWGTSLTAQRAQSELGSTFEEAEAVAAEAVAPTDEVAGV
ncbi:hypothetical protein B7486_70165, partial [cyanobacterium TDX16]